MEIIAAMGYCACGSKRTGRLLKIIETAAAVVFTAAVLAVSASAIFVLDDLDKPSRWSGSCTPEKQIVYQGGGALRIDSTDAGSGGKLCLAQKQIKSVDLSDYADGYIRFYLYVENEDNLGDSGQFELTSSGTCDVEELTCSINTFDLHSGWNEMVFSIAELSGAVHLDKVNFMRLYMFQTGDQTLVLDDICVGSAADFGIGEVAVKDKTVMTLDNCDSAEGYTEGSGAVPAVYTDIKIEGKGAVGAQSEGGFTLTKTLSQPLDLSGYVKSGYMYFWLYVDNADALSGDASFTLRSSDRDMVAWSLDGLKKGWNELLFKFSDTGIGSGAIDFKKIRSFSLDIGGSGANIFALDRVLYGYSRDFGIKNSDDPAVTAAVQTGTPANVTSANSGVYTAVTVSAVIVAVCALVPLAAARIKQRRGSSRPASGSRAG